MESRRTFLKASAAAALASGSVLGANDRIQLAIIGYGRRSQQLRHSFARNEDCVFVAVCDVDQSRMENVPQAIGPDVQLYGDYRRVLERKDIDAVIIGTPDHWHAPILEQACEAGKDVYVEKPVSNTVEAGWRMVEAAKKYNRVVQVGTQQRSWGQFEEWAQKIRDGYLGQMNHAVLQLFSGGGPRGGGGGRGAAPRAESVPEGLDWEMWQGPAEHIPYNSARHRGWRSYWDYAGGTLSDWGTHLTDVMLWYMNADKTAPLVASGSAQSVFGEPDPERAPDTFSVTWKYEKFVGTFMNVSLPSTDARMRMSDSYGNWFHGQNGALLVNRYGYSVTPIGTAVEAERVMDPDGIIETPESIFSFASTKHARNFLDCIKSRQQPVCDMETGFYSTLPTMLANLAIRNGRSYTFENGVAKAT